MDTEVRVVYIKGVLCVSRLCLAPASSYAPLLALAVHTAVVVRFPSRVLRPSPPKSWSRSECEVPHGRFARVQRVERARSSADETDISSHPYPVPTVTRVDVA